MIKNIIFISSVTVIMLFINFLLVWTIIMKYSMKNGLLMLLMIYVIQWPIQVQLILKDVHLSVLITTHKSQSITAHNGIVYEPSKEKPFARGLPYVAISRATDLDKVALLSAIRPDHFINKTFTLMKKYKIHYV